MHPLIFHRFTFSAPDVAHVLVKWNRSHGTSELSRAFSSDKFEICSFSDGWFTEGVGIPEVFRFNAKRRFAGRVRKIKLRVIKQLIPFVVAVFQSGLKANVPSMACTGKMLGAH